MQRGTKIAIGLAGAAAAVGLVVAVSGNGAPVPPAQQWKGAPPPEALAVGAPNDPEIVALLTEMRDAFASAGVNLDWVTPEEVTLLHKKKWAGQHAIPPREYWPRMIQTILTVFEPIRAVYGRPLRITNGYRPPWYNLEVTKTQAKPQGNPGSRHQWFEAIDFVPTEGGAAPRIEVAEHLAALYLAEGPQLRMGLGIYPPSEWPGGFHVDTGWRKRKWANTLYWLNQVQTA